MTNPDNDDNEYATCDCGKRCKINDMVYCESGSMCPGDYWCRKCSTENDDLQN